MHFLSIAMVMHSALSLARAPSDSDALTAGLARLHGVAMQCRLRPIDTLPHTLPLAKCKDEVTRGGMSFRDFPART